MSKQIQANDDDQPMDSLSKLRHRADMLGIKYGPNIKEDALRKKIQEVLGDEDEEPVTQQTGTDSVFKENMKLVRIRLTCMNPNKKDLPGEIITVGNEILGEVSKFIPYGSESENGYHVPNIIYKFLKDRKCIILRQSKDKVTGRSVVSESVISEYAIEVLPQLTEKELKDLANAQLAAGSIE